MSSCVRDLALKPVVVQLASVSSDVITLVWILQAVYTIGQRLVFFFPILAMWLLGPTAMLVTSVIVTSAVFILDQWNPQNPTTHIAEVLEYRSASVLAADS